MMRPPPRSALFPDPTLVRSSHVPAVWHWSLAVQVTGLAPVQTPERQVSVWVHALPSLQAVPSGASGFEHTPVHGLQVPATPPRSPAVPVNRMAPPQTPERQGSAFG